jgi:DNA repair exonuclease SbcCD ATPase subunit
MRLKSLELAGFRGFADEQVFDLDADAVVIVGANGNGKTSLLDAVLWALSGCVPRLGLKDELLVSKFSETGAARVALQLRENDSPEAMTVTRFFDGERSTVTVETGSTILHGPEAEGRLIQLIRQEAATAAVPGLALAGSLTQSTYLQQDLVREFIDSATEQERFNSVSELVGAGRITELQAGLMREKAAWTKTTNARSAELSPLRNRLTLMESRLADFRARAPHTNGVVDAAAWEAWWVDLRGLDIGVARVRADSREAAETIDAVIKELEVTRRTNERRQQLLGAVARDLAAIKTKKKPDLESLRGSVAIAEAEVREIRDKVAGEQSRLAEVRRLQAELKDKSEQIRALADLALKCLSERCPVCDQEYDIAGTRRRLELLSVDGKPAARADSPTEALADLLLNLKERENEHSKTALALRAGEQAAADIEAAEMMIDRRFSDLALTRSVALNPDTLIQEAMESALRQAEIVARATQTGESFAVRVSNVAAESAMEELRRESDSIRLRIQSEERAIAGRTATGDEAQRVIESLREVALTVVTERVKEIEPLLGELYSRIDVHPAFRAVRFLASVVGGKGRLSTVVSDPFSGVESDHPAAVLSSSQMNALAVCVFLSLNLGISDPPLETAILDDPLQSLDDINLLGLVDLLRRTKDQRQLCVSTHDVRFGNLLARKLRPRSPEQRTIIIELEGWGRKGPVVNSRDIKCDPAPIRLMASESDAA